MVLSEHRHTLRTVALCMAFGDDRMTLIRGEERFIATFDRETKSVIDAVTKKDYSSPFMWALDKYGVEQLSTTNLLFIGGLRVVDWMKKIRKDKNVRKAFVEFKFRLINSFIYQGPPLPPKPVKAEIKPKPSSASVKPEPSSSSAAVKPEPSAVKSEPSSAAVVKPEPSAVKSEPSSVKPELPLINSPHASNLLRQIVIKPEKP